MVEVPSHLVTELQLKKENLVSTLLCAPFWFPANCEDCEIASPRLIFLMLAAFPYPPRSVSAVLPRFPLVCQGSQPHRHVSKIYLFSPEATLLEEEKGVPLSADHIPSN